jgi:hypothetical protein
MGLFSKKPKDTRTPADLAAINLNQRLNFRPHNYHDVSISFLSHAFPDSPMFMNRSLLPTECSSQVVHNALERFVSGSLAADDLTQLVFGLSSISELVNQIFLIKRTSCSAATANLLDKLSKLEWSVEWDRTLDTRRVNAYVWDCLGDVGSRPATHSGLAHGGWRHYADHAIHYAEATKIGFVAVAEPFNRSASTFGWRQDPESQVSLLAAVVTQCPSVPNPLDVISDQHLSSVQERCEQIAFRLTRMFGDRSGAQVLPYTFSADSFSNSLMTAARHGAMLAAIGIDPSACRIYTGRGDDARQMAPDEFPWLER